MNTTLQMNPGPYSHSWVTIVQTNLRLYRWTHHCTDRLITVQTNSQLYRRTHNRTDGFTTAQTDLRPHRQIYNRLGTYGRIGIVYITSELYGRTQSYGRIKNYTDTLTILWTDSAQLSSTTLFNNMKDLTTEGVASNLLSLCHITKCPFTFSTDDSLNSWTEFMQTSGYGQP